MSAVLTPAEPAVDQLPLIPQATVQLELVRCSVWGRLTRQAEVRVATDGSGFLVVQVLQPHGKPAFVAMRHEPADRLHQLHLQAEQMHAGTAVVIVGRGFELTTLDGAPAIRPRICDAIGLADFCFTDEGPST